MQSTLSQKVEVDVVAADPAQIPLAEPRSRRRSVPASESANRELNHPDLPTVRPARQRRSFGHTRNVSQPAHTVGGHSLTPAAPALAVRRTSPHTRTPSPPWPLTESLPLPEVATPSADPGVGQDFPFPASQSSPYASPVHHLLSLHENLREEVSRVANAIQELEGRHSMLILNENLRMKEEMAYIGGQVNGVARQVGWLTSARLQEHSRGQGTMVQRAAEAGPSSARTLGSNSRVAEASREGLGMGRRVTDEGRTKL